MNTCNETTISGQWSRRSLPQLVKCELEDEHAEDHMGHTAQGEEVYWENNKEQE